MNTITITLTAYNMGPQTTTEDFDAWRRYVCDHIDEALNVSVDSVDQHSLVVRHMPQPARKCRNPGLPYVPQPEPAGPPPAREA